MGTKGESVSLSVPTSLMGFTRFPARGTQGTATAMVTPLSPGSPTSILWYGLEGLFPR